MPPLSPSYATAYTPYSFVHKNPASHCRPQLNNHVRKFQFGFITRTVKSIELLQHSPMPMPSPSVPVVKTTDFVRSINADAERGMTFNIMY